MFAGHNKVLGRQLVARGPVTAQDWSKLFKNELLKVKCPIMMPYPTRNVFIY